MSADERDKLLDLYRAAMKAHVAYQHYRISAQDLTAADDAFREYLFSLEVSA